MRTRPILRFEEKIEGEQALLAALGRSSDRRRQILAAAAAIAILAAAAFLPRPTGAAAPPAVAALPGDWTIVDRGMPAPPAPAGAPAPRTVSARRDAAPAPISLDVFRLPEPIPEPAASPFPPPASAGEPEAPLGTPERPPAEVAADSPGEPEVETVPPQIAPGGKVAPQYPIAARSLRLSGNVKLEVDVDASGTVDAVRVLGTDRPGVGFEEAASRAVERWRFVPATRGGVPVPATTVVEVTFRW